MAINTCQYSKCSKDFKTRKSKKKFCSNKCFLEHRKENPELYCNKGKKFTKIGDLIIRKETLKTGNVKCLKFINVGDGKGGIKYIRNDKFVWEQANGPLPAKHVIYHKDGRSLNDDLENLECITLGEALSRYSALREVVYDLTNKKDVAKIIRGCQINDRRMQKLLFDMTYNNCMITAMRYAHDNDAAQDILSDSFIKVFKSIHTFNSEGSLEGWIRKIVANTALDSIRKNKNTFVMDSDDMIHFDDMIADDNEFELDGVEEIKELPTSEILEEIQNLPPGYRAAFNMFVFEQMTHKDIAEKLLIAEGTSKSNVSKARIILKKRIKERIEHNQRLQNKRIEAFRLADVCCSN